MERTFADKGLVVVGVHSPEFQFMHDPAKVQLAARQLGVRFRVTIDGVAPGASHGADIDTDGWGEVREDRLYQLVGQQRAIG